MQIAINLDVFSVQLKEELSIINTIFETTNFEEFTDTATETYNKSVEDYTKAIKLTVEREEQAKELARLKKLEQEKLEQEAIEAKAKELVKQKYPLPINDDVKNSFEELFGEPLVREVKENEKIGVYNSEQEWQTCTILKRLVYRFILDTEQSEIIAKTIFKEIQNNNIPNLVFTGDKK